MSAKEKHLNMISKRFDYQNILTIMPKSLILKDMTKQNHVGDNDKEECTNFDEEFFDNL